MKAERRHVLQENSLARVMQNLPVAARLYADKILLVVVIILAIVMLIRWRVNAAQERELGAVEALAAARSSILQLGRLPPTALPQQIAEVRSTLRSDAERALDTVSRDASTSDTTVRAEALLARADLYWALANLPELSGAATQPSLKFSESHDELLKQGEETYQQILQSYGGNSRLKASALFGLAAIAEDRHQWEEAAKQYDQIMQADVEPMYKDLAEARLKLIPEIQQPMLLGSMTTKPAELILAPTTQTSTTKPTTQTATPAK